MWSGASATTLSESQRERRRATHHQLANVVRERVAVANGTKEGVPAVLRSLRVSTFRATRDRSEFAHGNLGGVEERLVERGEAASTATFANGVADDRGALGRVLVRDARHTGGGREGVSARQPGRDEVGPLNVGLSREGHARMAVERAAVTNTLFSGSNSVEVRV